MARDAVAGMRHHGFDRFDVLAHDRGARVAHRLAVDHPRAVERLMLLDVAPTLAMYEQTSDAFARAYWHWFFLIQPPPLPEALIESDPARYVRSVMGSRHAGLAPFAPEALAEYAMCRGFGANAPSGCPVLRWLAATTFPKRHPGRWPRKRFGFLFDT
jgi:haloacetate dehalogenase